MGPFELLVEVFASGTLLFKSAVAVERFILKTPALKRASAFPWWTGSGNQWGAVVTGRRGEFLFVRQDGLSFIAGDERL